MMNVYRLEAVSKLRKMVLPRGCGVIKSRIKRKTTYCVRGRVRTQSGKLKHMTYPITRRQAATLIPIIAKWKRGRHCFKEASKIHWRLLVAARAFYAKYGNRQIDIDEWLRAREPLARKVSSLEELQAHIRRRFMRSFTSCYTDCLVQVGKGAGVRMIFHCLSAFAVKVSFFPADERKPRIVYLLVSRMSTPEDLQVAKESNDPATGSRVDKAYRRGTSCTFLLEGSDPSQAMLKALASVETAYFDCMQRICDQLTRGRPGRAAKRLKELRAMMRFKERVRQNPDQLEMPFNPNTLEIIGETR